MKPKDDHASMSRRAFLKIGVVTATAATTGLSCVGKALDAAAAESKSSPDLVYRTLGRTGLKPTVVSFGAMLTPDHEVIRAGFDLGIGIVAMKTQVGGYKTDALGPISPHQAALKWVLQDANITMSIAGMRDMNMLQEDTSVMGMMKLTSADTQILNRYSKAISPYYCHLCAQCEPACPENVAISIINRSLMYAEGYGDIGLAGATYSEIKRNQSASACLDCAGCTARCANGIDITEKMRKARTLFA